MTNGFFIFLLLLLLLLLPLFYGLGSRCVDFGMFSCHLVRGMGAEVGVGVGRETWEKNGSCGREEGWKGKTDRKGKKG